MEIFSFKIDPKTVKRGQQEGEPLVRVSNPCPCGCSSKPFVSISDGNVGVTVRFETEAELDNFKSQVNQLNRG